ncbi:S-methyl-5-thioribose kinase [Paraburkholderia sp. DHOC27]|uniref:S-methyl-5-thioribose kinase n=1 Tax=Paraburkholderia sp. DHOC27 TaxID=2303330 RepID=UPI000E3CDF93|nr:S-methyl-5-thioribose kinase [Paraburkholderia sp. DHOC27]RFU48157.1 S-methyl-5-thioribose kinase [Paraburkholderia sp. DHOC27]
MEFEALTSSELAAYLHRIPAVNALLGDDSELDVVEVGDGNLNYVYFVSNVRTPQQSVVVKQAPPFLRLVGEAWPLTRHRMEHEVAALRRFGELCPQHVPRVYHADNELFLMVMQRLASHRILRQGLKDGIVYPKLAAHMSTYLARTLFYGSDLFLDAAAKKEAAGVGINSELCKITEELVFTFPFEDHPSNVYSAALPKAAIERLRHHVPLRVAAAQMKWAFMNHAETLLHGDLHTGSIMANQDETYVIDPEFAFYGPMAFDVGALLANFLLAFFSREWHGRQNDGDPKPFQAWLLKQVVDVWNGFATQFVALWREHEESANDNSKNGATVTPFIGDDANHECAEAYRAAFMRQLFTDTLGFVGCKMIRRVVGMAKVAEITSIPDAAVRAAVEVRCLQCAEALLVQRESLTRIEEVIELASALQMQREVGV